MRYPKFLPENGRIGYIAPSFGAADEWYGAKLDAALAAFKKMGYTNVTGPNCYAAEGIGKSNTPEKCAAELNDFFLNDKSDVILSVGGGETMCENLPFVDFEAIAKAEPKWFMGYSDNTNMTMPLAVLCDTASIYGQCAGTFGMREWHPSLNDDLRILTGKKDDDSERTREGNTSDVHGMPGREECFPSFTFHNYDSWEGPAAAESQTETGEVSFESGESRQADEADTPTEKKLPEPEDPNAPWNLNRPSCFTAYAPGCMEPTKEKISFRGRLLGGCLDCLVVQCGTKYDRVKEFAEKYKEDGIVWFLEACDLNPMSIRRALWQLREAGWFKNVKGFIIGRPLHLEEEIMGMNRTNAVLGILRDLNVPVLMDTDLGHMPPAIPYITGAIAEVGTEADRMTVRQILR